MAHSLSSTALTEALVRANEHWQLRHQAGSGAVEKAASPPFAIAVSREAGTYGAGIARAAADQLGWPLYDRQLLQRIADDMGVHHALLDSVDERNVSWLTECLESFSQHQGISQYAYFHRLLQTLLSLAAHGNCVIVGRGATIVFPEATTLRVRIVAPLEFRIEAVRREHGISKDEAARRVAAIDKERDTFVREHFQTDASDPRNYDLVLNAARFPVVQCVEMIVAALNHLKTASSVRSASGALITSNAL